MALRGRGAKVVRFLIALFLMTTCASAQTADEQARLDALTGSQIGDLVLQTNKLRVQIGTLQSQLASAQQKVKDLEAKAAEAQKPSEDKQEGK